MGRDSRVGNVVTTYGQINVVHPLGVNPPFKRPTTIHRHSLPTQVLALVYGLGLLPALQPGRSWEWRVGDAAQGYSRMIMSWASRSRSTKGSPLTSMATRSMVPPMKV